jgi:hypothetical protein
MQRFILRHCGPQKAQTARVATRLQQDGVHVIDATPTMLLFDAEPALAHSVAGKFSGWELVHETFTPKPKPRRPALKHPAVKKAA